MQHPLLNATPSFARIDAANHQINVCVLADLLYLCLHALPVQTPEEIDPVGQHDSFREADFRAAKRLPHTVGFADRVGINQGHSKSARMSKGDERLMKVRKYGHDGAAVSATADDKYANWP